MTFRKPQLLALVCSTLAAASCGGGSSNGNPTGPSSSTSPTQQNRPPVINSMSVSPQFGIQQLTLFTFSANASDPDGDPLTYSWNIGGASASGSSTTGTFSSGGAGTATVTVSDGRGGAVTDSRTFVVGSATGTWSGSGQGLGSFTMRLTQSNGIIAGTYQDSVGAGGIDPAQPGTINSAGRIEMRVKQGPFTDWTFRGTMSQTGREINGQIFGSGFSGQAFVMRK